MRGLGTRLGRLAVSACLAATIAPACPARPASPGRVAAQAWTDLITPLQSASPRLRFHMGRTGADGQPLIENTLPAIPGDASSWYVAQWQQQTYLSPPDLRATTGGWTFATEDGHAALRITPNAGGYAYLLHETDGTVTDGGGANLFLATSIRPGASDFARPVLLDLAYAVRDARISYATPAARTTGAVQAMAFVGLGLMFHAPHGESPDRFVFMQIPMTVSRTVPPGPGVMCSLANDTPSLLYAPDTGAQPFAPATQVVHRTYRLDALVRQMLAAPYPCAGRLLPWPGPQAETANWRLTGLYVGLETQNRDGRAHASPPPAQGHTSPPPAQGHASIAVQLLGLSVRRQANRP